MRLRFPITPGDTYSVLAPDAEIRADECIVVNLPNGQQVTAPVIGIHDREMEIELPDEYADLFGPHAAAFSFTSAPEG
jgi:hypothetical protein